MCPSVHLLDRTGLSFWLSVRASLRPHRTGSSCAHQSISITRQVAIIFKSKQSASISFTPKMPAGKKSVGQRKPSQKQRRLKQKATQESLNLKRHGVYLEEPPTKAVKSEGATTADNCGPPPPDDQFGPRRPGEAFRDYERRVKTCLDETGELPPRWPLSDFGSGGELSDFDETGELPAGLSHKMAKFLRHTAYYEDLLDEDGWVPLCDALPRLHCTAAQVAKAVQLSDRYDDEWGCGARFEMYKSGSCTWIRATDGAYYRQRSSAKLHCSPMAQRSSTAR